jgi:hypothetical protein
MAGVHVCRRYLIEIELELAGVKMERDESRRRRQGTLQSSNVAAPFRCM